MDIAQKCSKSPPVSSPHSSCCRKSDVGANSDWPHLGGNKAIKTLSFQSGSFHPGNCYLQWLLASLVNNSSTKRLVNEHAIWRLCVKKQKKVRWLFVYLNGCQQRLVEVNLFGWCGSAGEPACACDNSQDDSLGKTTQCCTWERVVQAKVSGNFNLRCFGGKWMQEFCLGWMVDRIRSKGPDTGSWQFSLNWIHKWVCQL